MIQAPSLAFVRDMAEERAGVPGHEAFVERAKTKGAWNRLGKLKRLLIDDLTAERNRYAKDVMGDVRARRKEVGAVR